MWGGRLGTVGVPPGRQQNRVRLPAHPAMAAVTKHRPRAGVAGDVLVSCLAPALGGWGSPSPARGLPAAAITQHRWPWGGLWAGGIWSRRGAAPCGEGAQGAQGPPSPCLHSSTCVNRVRPRRRPGGLLGVGGREGLWAPGGPWGAVGCAPHPCAVRAWGSMATHGLGHVQPCPRGAGPGDGCGAMVPWGCGAVGSWLGQGRWQSGKGAGVGG